MDNQIAKIQQNIRQVRNNIHHISETELSFKSSPEKWSKKEILGHLIDSARYNWARFNDIVKSENPNAIFEIKSYTQDAQVKLNNYQETAIAELVILWQSINTQICKTIAQIPAQDLQRKITWLSEVRTLKWLITDYVVHMNHHLNQILDTTNNQTNSANSDNPIFANHITQEQAIKKLGEVSTEFVKLIDFGDLEIEYYQPNKIDKQTPHTKDELYIIAKGNGTFIRENESYAVKENDVLFVKAGETHKFLDFTDDFATWVVFYGLER